MIHRVNWDLRYPPCRPAAGAAAAAAAAKKAAAAAAPAAEAGVVQLPIPSHDIGARGPHVAPGTFKVTLEVDGAAAESRTFEVRADPASAVTLAQHKAREAFVVEVMDLQAKVETLAADLRTRRAAATGDEAARLQALEQRLGGGGGGGGRGGGRGGGGHSRCAAARRADERARSLGRADRHAGQPTVVMKTALAEAKAELAAIEKEIKASGKH